MGPAFPRHGDRLLASAVTGLGVPALAWLALQVFPQGCDLRGDPEVYRWTCLLPGLLIMVPLVVAVILPLVMILNRRLARPFPDGWLPASVAFGVLTQLVLTLGFALTLGPAYRGAFLSEVLTIPQPFVAGFLSAAVYSFALHLRRRSSPVID
ncbi:hypothetical protein EF888_02985 [Silicimonas algicola]|uniref:hypothetical protein n=1 Tax=Silicimonas algicola TaxID=1826607 RepID=UPI000F84F791|nr:hypothetical protein [Silicimonas algicola]AZQ66182.1 hypothetical protein EF888_02985 [Silicimonas algicola]